MAPGAAAPAWPDQARNLEACRAPASAWPPAASPPPPALPGGSPRVLVDATWGLAVITAGYSGADSPGARSVAVPRRSGVLGALQAGPADHGPGSRRGDPGLPGSEPAAGSWEASGSGTGAGWRAGWAGAVASARVRREPASPGAPGWRPARALSSRSWERWRLAARAGPAPAEINDESQSPRARAGGAGQVYRAANVGPRKTGQASPPTTASKQTASRRLVSGAPTQAAAAAGAGA